jgi:hypothetical protein
MAKHTLTLDVAGLKYIDKDGIEHVINTNETMTLTFTDTGTGGTFVGLVGGGKMTCTDGFEFEVSSESRFVFLSSADEETFQNGEIAFVEENNVLNVFEVTSLTMTNADGVGANNITEIVMEQVANRMRKMTWTNINTA